MASLPFREGDACRPAIRHTAGGSDRGGAGGRGGRARARGGGSVRLRAGYLPAGGCRGCGGAGAFAPFAAGRGGARAVFGGIQRPHDTDLRGGFPRKGSFGARGTLPRVAARSDKRHGGGARGCRAGAAHGAQRAPEGRPRLFDFGLRDGAANTKRERPGTLSFCAAINRSIS